MKLGKFLIKLLNMLSDNETKKRRKHYPPHGEFEETINIPYIEGSFNPQTSFDVYLANDNRNNICVIDAIYVLETLFDAFKEDVDAKIAQAAVASIPWYHVAR